MFRKILFCIISLIALANCSGATAPPPGPALVGPLWQLVEIQSMDDSGPDKGITRPSTPSRYTVEFKADKSVNMQFDCNRGRGTYTSTPGAKPDAGDLRMTPMAVTRMACLPQNLGDKVARDMDYVRSYRIKDGRLYLSLMADGGIYVWAPQTK